MKRTQLSLTDRQVTKLNKLAEGAGVSFAEMLRRVLDASPEMRRLDEKGPVPPKPKRGRAKDGTNRP